MKNQKEITRKWIDGRMIQGAYLQWLVEEHPEALNLKVIFIIARHTLGYRKRYAYLNENLFGLTHSTKWRQIKKAKELGLLEYSTTAGYTKFKLILSDEIENNTLWRGSNSKDEPKKETREEYIERSNKEAPKSLLGKQKGTRDEQKNNRN